ncbi:Short-chain dehydrogenase/reductase SDR [Penicillium verhagenii]|nr:Short-chain dehydrogenase/reductase SDR [Penicillium verhagenii]
MSSLSPASILITGCSAGGIGYALAVQFQKSGLRVFASARSMEKMADLGNLPNVTLISLDVTDSSNIQEAVKVVEKSTGRLDYLVNNAGIFTCMPLLDVSLESAKQLFETNVWGTLTMTQAFAPLLIKSKGKIINISSITGDLNIPWVGIYAASKAAIMTIGETLRLELAPFEVDVLTVVAGAVDTHIFDNGPSLVLPPESIYHKFGTNIENRVQAKDSDTLLPFWMETGGFARKVVNDSLGSSKGKTWRGSLASCTYFARSYLWTRIVLICGVRTFT